MAETTATHGGRPTSPPGRAGGAPQGDARLAALAASGDERAFESLVRRFDASLRGYCVQLLGSVEDAEDALQDALASAHRALIERGPPDEPRAWLFTIVRNRCLGLLRSRRPQPATLDDSRLPAAAGAAEVALSRADLRALVRDLARLDADSREALVLTRLGDFSHREAAAIIGCAPERVRTLVRQARIELAAGMAAREQPCQEIQVELAELRRGGFRRAHIRKHLAACEVCSSFRVRLAERERGLAVLLPVPAAAIEALGRGGDAGGAAAALGAGGGASTAGTGGLLAFGGAKLAATLAAGVAIVGGGGALVTATPDAPALTARGAEPEPAVTPPARDDGAVRRSSTGQEGSQGEPAPDAPPPPVDPVATTAPKPDDHPSRATATQLPEPERDSSGSRGSQTGEIPSAADIEVEDAPPPPEPDTDGPRPAPEPEDPDAGGDGGPGEPGPSGSRPTGP